MLDGPRTDRWACGGRGREGEDEGGVVAGGMEEGLTVRYSMEWEKDVALGLGLGLGAGEW